MKALAVPTVQIRSNNYGSNDYSKPNLSRPNSVGHRGYPYLLRGLSVEQPAQIWGVDITSVRLRSGFLYLVIVLNWCSRQLVAWELSNSSLGTLQNIEVSKTLKMPFVLTCAEAAFKHAVPEISSRDQGSHFNYDLSQS